MKIISPIWMFIIALVALFISAVALNNITKAIAPNPSIKIADYEVVFWFFRVVIALAASAISISIPGMLKVSYNEDGTFIQLENEEIATLADKQPKIVAGGAIAVFVLVYLFNPLV